MGILCTEINHTIVGRVFKRPVRVLLVLLFTLLVSNRSPAAFVIRRVRVAMAAKAAGIPALNTSVVTKYRDMQTRLMTRNYKLYNFDRPGRMFDGQHKKTNDLAWAGGICVMAGIAGTVIAAGYNLEDVVTYCAVGVIVVGAILIAIGVIHMQRSKKNSFAVTSPKNNELGVAYNF